MKKITIKNFKSINHIEFEPKRVNVFIGEGGAGKTNILECIDKEVKDTKTYIYNDYRGEVPNEKTSVLKHPFGLNLFLLLSVNTELREQVSSLLNLPKKYFHHNLSETYKRAIFYLVAMETNKNATLLFDGLGEYMFPKMIKFFANMIILDDENQYFLSTHSPYMLNPLISSLGDDELNIILTYYKDNQTKIKVLNNEELSEIQEWNMDVFFNLDKFIKL